MLKEKVRDGFTALLLVHREAVVWRRGPFRRGIAKVGAGA
jgi:hypothetical protein